MKNGLKLALLLAVSCMVALGIAACGGGGGDDSSSGDGSEELTGTVTVWDFEYGSLPEYTKGMKKLDADFERLHPGLKVNRVAVSQEGYEAQYRAAFASQEGPDIMTLSPGAAGILSFKQGLEPLNEWITPDLEEHVDLWESVTPDYTAEGDRYGVPLSLQGWVFYYNKKMFAEAGLPTEFEPKSWAEVREAGEALKKAGIQPFTGGNKEGFENGWWFTVGFRSENTPEQAEELATGAMPYTDPAIAKAFGPGIEMEEAGLYPSNRFATALYTEGYPSFAEEKGAMVLGFWNGVGYWGEYNPALGEKNVGMFFAPGNAPVGATPGIAYGMTKFAGNKDAAWALLEYTVSKEGVETMDEVGGMLPIRNDVSLAPDAPIQARKLMDAWRNRDPVLEPIVYVPSQVLFGTMATEMNQVLEGRTSLEDAQEAMQETAERTSNE